MNQLAAWCMQRRARIGWLIVGLAIAGWGIHNWLIGRSTAELLALPVAELEGGKEPGGRWLELTGLLLKDDRIIWPEQGPAYYPLVSEDWQPGTPIAVFIRGRPEDSSAGRLRFNKEPSVVGILDPQGLPLELRERFEIVERPAAARAIVVDFEKKPGRELIEGYVLLTIGATVLSITGLVWISYREPVGQPISPESGKVVSP